MLVDAGKENYSDTDHVCNVILSKKNETEMVEMVGTFYMFWLRLHISRYVKNGGQSLKSVDITIKIVL